MSALALELNPLITPRAAVQWFLLDMAEVSGFMHTGFKNMSPLSVYGSYRPILTQPDPWYFAGVVALEVSAVTDLFRPEGADDIMREVFDQMDNIVGRRNKEASALTMLLLGRMGIGSILMGRKVPDNMLSRVMLLLIGSDKAMKRVMPDDGALKQLRAALKSGPPVWWKMFARRYRLTTAPEAAIADKIAIPHGGGVRLPETIGEETSTERASFNLDALRVALVEAEITVPGAANDPQEPADPDDILETAPISADELIAEPFDEPADDPEPEPDPEELALSLEKYRVD
jgi:hypothetical protein